MLEFLDHNYLPAIEYQAAVNYMYMPISLIAILKLIHLTTYNGLRNQDKE